MIDVAGEDEKSKSFRQVAMSDYLEALGDDRPGAKGKGDKVAVIVAKGSIVDGSAGPGRIGGDSTAALVRQAARTRRSRPSSSASTAAEGAPSRPSSSAGSSSSPGKRRSPSSSRWAPSRRRAATGSPPPRTRSGPARRRSPAPSGSSDVPHDREAAREVPRHARRRRRDHLLGRRLRIDRALDPRIGEAIQLMINHGYEEFLARVSKARKMSRDDVDRIARGRVWSGADAKERASSTSSAACRRRSPRRRRRRSSGRRTR